MEYPFYNPSKEEKSLMFSVFLKNGASKTVQYFGLADITGLKNMSELVIQCSTCVIHIAFRKGFAKNPDLEESAEEIEGNTQQAIIDFHNLLKLYQIDEIHENDEFCKIRIYYKSGDDISELSGNSDIIANLSS